VSILHDRFAGFIVVEDGSIIKFEPSRPQPIPYYAKVITTPDGSQTAMLRRWNPGDTARCRLCPVGRCIADDDACFVMVKGRISEAQALTFDATKLVWPAEGGAR
jgi:hypothetical protein